MRRTRSRTRARSTPGAPPASASGCSGTGFGFGLFVDGRFSGEINLNTIQRGPFQNAYVGYWIDERCAGKSLMSEAVVVLAKYAFDELHLHRIQISIIPRNRNSRRVMEKLDIREEGTALRYLEINGVWEDHVRYAMTVEEWEERHEALLHDLGRLSARPTPHGIIRTKVTAASSEPIWPPGPRTSRRIVQTVELRLSPTFTKNSVASVSEQSHGRGRRGQAGLGTGRRAVEGAAGAEHHLGVAGRGDPAEPGAAHGDAVDGAPRRPGRTGWRRPRRRGSGRRCGRRACRAAGPPR